MLKALYMLCKPWGSATKSEILVNRIIGRVANYLYPIYCKIITPKKCVGNNSEVIISLTSFPARINQVHLCIQSILRQGTPAGRVILWLAESQFQDKKSLPSALLKLEKYGLEIRFCEDVKSYKKVIYTAQEFTDYTIITVDDDVLYPENFVERLLLSAKNNPECVVCYRAHMITFNNGTIAPYSEWVGMSPGIVGPSLWLVPTGVGGVLYPPNFFKGIEIDVPTIMSLCPTADDLWLKAMGMRKKIRVVKVDADTKEWFTILNTQRESLSSVNNRGERLNNSAMKNLVEYYDLNACTTKNDEERSTR